MVKSWSLEDAHLLAEENPKKLSTPSKDAIEPLEKGHKAKLIFSYKNGDSALSNSEQLWVEILMVQDNKKLLGQLEDDPQHIKDLQRGEIIEFEERHIIDTD